MGMERLCENQLICKALEYIKKDDERTLCELLEMCQIPAPSYMEKKKADYVLNKFQKIGLSNVHMDEIWNVFGTIKGSGDGPRVMLAAHTCLL